METICMKCQNLFSGKNKETITKLLSAEFFTQHAKCYLSKFKKKKWLIYIASDLE